MGLRMHAPVINDIYMYKQLNPLKYNWGMAKAACCLQLNAIPDCMRRMKANIDMSFPPFPPNMGWHYSCCVEVPVI